MNLLLVFPTVCKVLLGNSVHDADVPFQSLRLHEIGNQLFQLYGLLRCRNVRESWENLVDVIGPPNIDEPVLVGEQELVASRAVEEGSLLPKEGCLEYLRRVVSDAVEEELLRVTFPSRGHKIVALSDQRVPHVSRG